MVYSRGFPFNICFVSRSSCFSLSTHYAEFPVFAILCPYEHDLPEMNWGLRESHISFFATPVPLRNITSGQQPIIICKYASKGTSIIRVYVGWIVIIRCSKLTLITIMYDTVLEFPNATKLYSKICKQSLSRRLGLGGHGNVQARSTRLGGLKLTV